MSFVWNFFIMLVFDFGFCEMLLFLLLSFWYLDSWKLCCFCGFCEEELLIEGFCFFLSVNWFFLFIGLGCGKWRREEEKKDVWILKCKRKWVSEREWIVEESCMCLSNIRKLILVYEYKFWYDMKFIKLEF